MSGLGNWAGALGHDSVLIAYDALLGCNGSWNELCLRAMLHGGDNDSTGCLAGSWFGALYGFQGVSKKNYEVMKSFFDCTFNIIIIKDDSFFLSIWSIKRDLKKPQKTCMICRTLLDYNLFIVL